MVTSRENLGLLSAAIAQHPVFQAGLDQISEMLDQVSGQGVIQWLFPDKQDAGLILRTGATVGACHLLQVMMLRLCTQRLFMRQATALRQSPMFVGPPMCLLAASVSRAGCMCETMWRLSGC